MMDYVVFLGFVWFCEVLPGLTGFYWVLLSFTALYVVLRGYTWFNGVLLGFTDFYCI